MENSKKRRPNLSGFILGALVAAAPMGYALNQSSEEADVQESVSNEVGAIVAPGLVEPPKKRKKKKKSRKVNSGSTAVSPSCQQ